MTLITQKILESKWVFPAIILAAIFGCLVFLLPNPIEFPMDDAYIHLVYAENLKEFHTLFFSLPDEIGLGTSSILWVAIITLLLMFGIPSVLAPKIMGVLSLIWLATGVFRFITKYLDTRWGFLATGLIIFSGNLVWFSLSGMETVLFMAIGLETIVSIREKRNELVGILLGLLILTRPEGILLLVSVVLVEIIFYKRIEPRRWKPLILALFIILPWFVYVFSRTGDILPTSATGKQFSHSIASQYAASKIGIDVGILRNSAFLFLFQGITFFFLFNTGAMSLPEPYLFNGENYGWNGLHISLWALPIVVLLLLPLIISASAQLWHALTVQPKRHLYKTIWIFTLWIVLHNFAYLVFLPSIGTASRYLAINHLAFWLLIIMGLRYSHWPSIITKIKGMGLIILVIANFNYWNNVYDANVEHMRRVRQEAANYLKISPDPVYCSAVDIGAIRYFSNKPVFDLGGLIDPEAQLWFLGDRVEEYLLSNGVNCMLIPGREGNHHDGILDIFEMLGLGKSQDNQWISLRVFSVEDEVWRKGYYPTGNYQQSIVVYRLENSPNK